MNQRQSLVCVVAGLGVAESALFPVISETGNVWEILLGGEYRKVDKRSCRVQGWKDGPRFGELGRAELRSENLVTVLVNSN